MRVDWLGELRIALRIARRRRTARTRRRYLAPRTAAFELLEDRTLLAIDLSAPIFASAATIGSGLGGGPAVADLSNFGTAIAPLGDLDGDGVVDLAIGAASDRTSGLARGAVFVSFMNADGTVKSSQKIASAIGGGPVLANGDLFGTALAALGDLDGDGITELAIGASLNDTGGTNRGAVYVMFLNADGTAKSSVKFASDVNGGPTIANYDYFGSSIAAIGDLDGDGVRDMVVGAKLDDTGGENRGALHVLLLNSNGTVKASSKIASGTSGVPTLHNDDRFGTSVASVGDLDGDGVRDLAVSSYGNDGGLKNRGAVHVLFLHADGTAKGSQTIASSVGGGPTLAANDQFGSALAAVGDLDGDGINDLAVGANYDDTAGSERGAVYFVLMNADGTAKNVQKMTSGGLGGPNLTDGDYFGGSIALVGDLNGDGRPELAVGAPTDDTAGVNRGVVHVLVNRINRAPLITSADTASVIENSTAVLTVTVTDPDLPADALTFAIVGGPDQSQFAITPGGELSFVAAPDFELPTDADGDNRYEVVVEINDGHGGTATHAITVEVTPTNDAPHFTSADTASVMENSTAVLTVTATDPDVPADVLTISIVGGADQTYFAIAPGGELTFVSGPDFEAPVDSDGDNRYVVVIEVNDGLDGTALQSIAVEVTPTNDNIPQITSPNVVSVIENVSAVATVIASDADLPADGLTFAITGGADQSRFAIASSGELSFVAAPDFDLPVDADGDNRYEVVVEASDGHGGTAMQTITVEVTPTNDNAPQFTSEGSLNVAENSALVHAVTAIDADVPAEPISFSIVGGADEAHFAITSGGELSLVSGLDFELPADSDGDNRYVVVVEASDGQGGVATQTITVEVTPANDNTPQITSLDTVSIVENTTAVFTVIGSDADLPADALTFSLVGGADQAQFTITPSGELSFVAAPDFEVPTDADGDNRYEVVVEANDGRGGIATQTITVEVTPANDNTPQIASVDTTSIVENSTSVLTVTAIDADLPADTLTFAIVGGADQAHFAITPGGELSFVTAPDFELPTDADGDHQYDVIVEVNDGQGGVTAQTVHVIVTATNDHAPLFTSADIASVTENSTAVLTVAAIDADLPGDTLAFSIAGGADQALFAVSSSGELGFVTAPDFELPTDADGDNLYEVVVEVADGQGGTATQTIVVEVTALNDNAPYLTSPDLASVPENSTPVLTLTAADADLPADPLVFSIVGGADQALFAIATGGELTFVAAPDFELPADADGDNLYEVAVEVSDEQGGTATQTIRIEVTPANDHAPQITSPNLVSVPENVNGLLTVTATDVDLPADVLTFAIAGGADQAHFTITAGGELSFVAAPDFELPADTDGDNHYEVVIEVSDGHGGTSSQSITVEITATNDNAPQIASPAFVYVAENSTAVLTVTATDADLPLETIAFTLVGGADQSHFILNPGGELSFVTAPDFELPADANGDNQYEVIVEVSDGNGGTATQTIIVAVTPLNDNAPHITSPDLASVTENATAVLAVAAADADLPADPLVYSIVGGADQTLFTITVDGALSFVAAPDFEFPADEGGDNDYEVIVETSDGQGGTAMQAILVTITPLNDNQPVFTSPATVSVAENSTVVQTVTTTDADLPGDTVTFAIVGGADQSHFTVTSSGELAFVTAPDVEVPLDADGDNRYLVVVEASGGNGGTATQTITVEVTPVEEEPPVPGESGAASVAAAIDLALVDWPIGRSPSWTLSQPGDMWESSSSNEDLLIAAVSAGSSDQATSGDPNSLIESEDSVESESDDLFAELESLLLSPAI
jgi:VCBS repeat-containing protein